MFFVLSKVVFAVVRPLTLLILLTALGAALLATRWRRLGVRLVGAAALLLAVIGFTPFAALTLGLLEDRFPRPARVEPAPDGILVLGGSLDVAVETARPGVTALNEAAERLTEIAALARLYPDARIVFTGGTGELMPGGVTEAESARALFLAFGIAPERMLFEDRSRTTWENAELTRALVRPAPASRWLLVTSAFHMPRAVGVFRRAGWPGLVPFPTDYRTRGPGRWRLQPDPASENFSRFELAAKELLGLLAYRLTDRTDALLPGP